MLKINVLDFLTQTPSSSGHELISQPLLIFFEAKTFKYPQVLVFQMSRCAAIFIVGLISLSFGAVYGKFLTFYGRKKYQKYQVPAF